MQLTVLKYAQTNARKWFSSVYHEKCWTWIDSPKEFVVIVITDNWPCSKSMTAEWPLFRHCRISRHYPDIFADSLQHSHLLCNSREAYISICAFSALIPLVGHQEEHPACKNWVMRCWCGYLSRERCRLFAYGSADATAVLKPHHLLPRLNPDWFYLSGAGLPRLSWKRGH